MFRIWVFTFVLFFFIRQSFAKIIHVPDSAVSIQSGINMAVDGDTVIADDNIYVENINFKGKPITVASRFIIDGDSSHIGNTIICGKRPSHPDSGSVVYFISGEDTTSILYGFTIMGGAGTVIQLFWYNEVYPVKLGGGILCLNSGGRISCNKIIDNTISDYIEVDGGGLCAITLNKSDCVIVEDNQILNNTINGTDYAWGGGVMFTCNGRLTNNVISHNSCNATNRQAMGGGVNCYADSSDRYHVIIKGNRINHNSANGTQYPNNPAALGGGISVWGTNISILGNEICYNEISAFDEEPVCGSGIFMQDVPDVSQVIRNNISYNKVASGKGLGGAISLWKAKPIIINNVISGNSASYGAALRIASNSDAIIINNTITKNIATISGGGIYTDKSNPKLINSIVWANQAADNPGIAGSIEVHYSDVQGGYAGTGNINANPLFADILFQLSESSPCIGTGIDSMQIRDTWYHCPTIDYDSNPRPNSIDLLVDIGVWESPYAKPGTSTVILRSHLPKEFSIYQNYPNPFNPSTTIEYSIPKSSNVEISIFNLKGQKVKTLVNKKQHPGKYQVNWDGPNHASGVYIYQIKADKLVESKKMLLLK